MSRPIGVKLSIPCPYCNAEIYCILTKYELKLIMRGFKHTIEEANRLIYMKVDERGVAHLCRRTAKDT